MMKEAIFRPNNKMKLNAENIETKDRMEFWGNSDANLPIESSTEAKSKAPKSIDLKCFKNG